MHPIVARYRDLITYDRLHFDSNRGAEDVAHLLRLELFSHEDVACALSLKSGRLVRGTPAQFADDPVFGTSGMPVDTDAVRKFARTRIGKFAIKHVPTSNSNLVAAANCFVFKHCLGSKKRAREIDDLVWNFAEVRVQMGTDPAMRSLDRLTRDEQEALMYGLRVEIVHPDVLAAGIALYSDPLERAECVNMLCNFEHPDVVRGEYTVSDARSVLRKLSAIEAHSTEEQRSDTWMMPPPNRTATL